MGATRNSNKIASSKIFWGIKMQTLTDHSKIVLTTWWTSSCFWQAKLPSQTTIRAAFLTTLGTFLTSTTPKISSVNATLPWPKINYRRLPIWYKREWRQTNAVRTTHSTSTTTQFLEEPKSKTRQVFTTKAKPLTSPALAPDLIQIVAA